MSGLVAAAAALTIFVVIAFVFLVSVMQTGHPLALMAPHMYGVAPHMQGPPAMMPFGVLGSAAWLLSLALYAGLLVGLSAFVILYLGGAGAS